jgi:hypothetical protein
METLGGAFLLFVMVVVGLMTFFPKVPFVKRLRKNIQEYGVPIFCGGALLAIAIGITQQPADFSLKKWWESGARLPLPPPNDWSDYYFRLLWNKFFAHVEARYFALLVVTALIGALVTDLWKWFHQGAQVDQD